jgi:hypothetical protein
MSVPRNPKTRSFDLIVCGKYLFVAILLSCLGCPQDAIGQSRKYIDSLLSVVSRKLISDEYKNEDAVVLLQYRTVYNTFEVNKQYFVNRNPFWSGTGKYNKSVNYNSSQGYIEHLYQRIKILTRKGAEEYSKVFIPKSTVGKVVKILAKNIKPDGREIIVKSEDIKEVESVTNGVFDWKQGHYRFSVPGVEQGDELEIVYSISKPDNLATSGDYFFSSYLPVIQSTLVLNFSNAITVTLKNFNGLRNPENGLSHKTYSFTYTRFHLGALRDIDHAILYNEMPYCRYQILSVHSQFDTSPQGTPVSVANWTDFAKEFILSRNGDDLKETKSKFFNKFVSQHYTSDAETPQVGFRNIIRLIFDSIHIENTGQKPEFTSGYYLSNNSIPFSAIYKLYSDLFNNLGIEFYFCLGTMKTMGKLDTSLVSGGNFSSLFFAYKDENDSLRYLFPENNAVKINPEEINPFYLGSHFIMISAKAPGKHAFGKLPDYPCTFNYKKRKNKIFVDLEENLQHFVCQSVKAGAFSYLDRLREYGTSKDSVKSEFKNYFKNEMKNFTLDTSYLTPADMNFPYKTNFYYKGRQKDKLVRVADSLYSLDLSEWLDHNVLPAYSADRFVDYYPDFRYQEQFTYYYIFKTPVEVQNPSSLAGGINNDFGSYQFSVDQLSDTVILVQSTYKIVKDKLPSYEYDQLKQLYDQWALLKNSSLLVRVKPRFSGRQASN